MEESPLGAGWGQLCQTPTRKMCYHARNLGQLGAGAQVHECLSRIKASCPGDQETDTPARSSGCTTHSTTACTGGAALGEAKRQLWSRRPTSESLGRQVGTAAGARWCRYRYQYPSEAQSADGAVQHGELPKGGEEELAELLLS